MRQPREEASKQPVLKPRRAGRELAAGAHRATTKRGGLTPEGLGVDERPLAGVELNRIGRANIAARRPRPHMGSGLPNAQRGSLPHPPPTLLILSRTIALDRAG
jgi:hypothetical protein